MMRTDNKRLDDPPAIRLVRGWGIAKSWVNAQLTIVTDAKSWVDSQLNQLQLGIVVNLIVCYN